MQTPLEVPKHPKKSKILTARVSQEALARIKNQAVTLLISIGKDKFEGEDLTALLRFISENCHHCTLLAADTLQRFNIASLHAAEPDFTLEQAHAIALQKGHEWLATYQPLFNQMFITHGYQLSRWEDWRTDSLLAAKKQVIHARLDSDPDYAKALEASVTEYQQRQVNSSNHQALIALSPEIFAANCRDYLIEECAVFLLLAEKGVKHLLYPGASQAIIKQTFAKLIDPQPLTWIPVRFKRVQAATATLSHVSLFSPAKNVAATSPQKLLVEVLLHNISAYLHLLPTPEAKADFLQQLQQVLQEKGLALSKHTHCGGK